MPGAVPKPLARDTLRRDPTPRLQQSAEPSADRMHAQVPTSVLSALPSIAVDFGRSRAFFITSELPAKMSTTRKARKYETGMTDSLQITVESGKQGAVLYLRGRINVESSPGLRDHLLTMLRRQTPPAITIDLAGVSYMDTSGIATLIEALKIARIGGTAMNLRGLQGRLLHLFQAAGIGSLFDTGRPTNNPATTAVS
jgi:anti-sigma B factor antagonist